MQVKETLEARFIRMNVREEELRTGGYLHIVGVDEVGRGPLAGPVCVAACILDPKRPILGLNDSKKLSLKKRLVLLDEIKEAAITYSVKLIAPHYIDTHGINAAIRLATDEALYSLNPRADYALFDYVSWDLPIEGEKIVQGDAHCNCIAAASILAKVTRDRYMQELDFKYPGYGFSTNVGYGSKAHLDALINQGPCPAHRHSFISKIIARRKEASE